MTVVLDGRSLTLDGLHAVAVDRAPVALAADARARMTTTRRVVERVLATGAPVYGVNTGFGKLSDIAIPSDRLAALQTNLLRSHAAGVGAPLAEREVRAMMALRANCLASGHSGARPEVVDLLVALLNAGLWPRVPEQGSVGASGDLAPLAHLALPLIGEGELFGRDGVADAAGAVLARQGLTPLALAPKEGLALINGTQAHVAVAGLACHEAFRLLGTADVAAALTLDALLGTPDAYDARIHAARAGQPEQGEVAARLRALLRGSAIRESHRDQRADPRVQDAYALRCVPQVHGPVRATVAFAARLLGGELNAATDNPLVFEDGALLSGGNFHGLAGGTAADVLAIALTQVAVMSERRIDRLVHPDLNQGLPPFLAPEPGLHSGFMMAQVTAAALTSECKGLSHPATVDTIPTDGSKEDVVPMAMGAALKLRRVVVNVRRVLAIELMCAAQGIDLRRPLTTSAALEQVHAAIRDRVAPLDADRVLSGDIEALAQGVADGAFVPPPALA